MTVKQKAALEMHDAAPKPTASPPTPKITVDAPADGDSGKTVKHKDEGPENETLKGRPAGLSVGRGDLDQAIRSMRSGKRRERNVVSSRPLSRIFVDGARTSRVFEP